VGKEDFSPQSAIRNPQLNSSPVTRHFSLFSSHPEKTFPDENTQLPAIINGQKPFEKGFVARAPCGNPGVSIRKFEFPDGNYLVSEVPAEGAGVLAVESLLFSVVLSLLSAGLSFFPAGAESPLRA
jgi:hypothetical protein